MVSRVMSPNHCEIFAWCAPVARPLLNGEPERHDASTHEPTQQPWIQDGSDGPSLSARLLEREGERLFYLPTFNCLSRSMEERGRRISFFRLPNAGTILSIGPLHEVQMQFYPSLEAGIRLRRSVKCLLLACSALVAWPSFAFDLNLDWAKGSIVHVYVEKQSMVMLPTGPARRTEAGDCTGAVVRTGTGRYFVTAAHCILDRSPNGHFCCGGRRDSRRKNER